MPTYFDTIDYGSSQSYLGAARYDLFGVNPATGVWMLKPLVSKAESSVEEGLKAVHSQGEDLSKLTLRSDRANELVAAASSLGAYADPTGPHRPNSNKAERSILTFSDLLRIHFLQSGFAPCFRPLLAVLVCQLYNLFKVVKRLDTDRIPFKKA